jgi:hypothetical protein
MKITTSHIGAETGSRTLEMDSHRLSCVRILIPWHTYEMEMMGCRYRGGLSWEVLGTRNRLVMYLLLRKGPLCSIELRLLATDDVIMTELCCRPLTYNPRALVNPSVSFSTSFLSFYLAGSRFRRRWRRLPPLRTSSVQNTNFLPSATFLGGLGSSDRPNSTCFDTMCGGEGVGLKCPGRPFKHRDQAQ